MMLALGSAIAGALGYGVGSVLQAAAARRATGTAVPRHPLYLLGVGFDLVAFAASFVAARQLPLFAVQSVLAGSLAVTVVLARVFLGHPLRRVHAAAVTALVAALAVLASAAGTQSALPPPSWFPEATLLAMAGAGGLLAWAYRRGGATHLALIAGVCFAGSAIGVRAVTLDGHWLALLGQPIAWSVAGFGLIGSFAYARSLERGSAGSATAILWVTEVTLAGLVGIAALGDHVLPGWGLPALCALGVALVGCVILAGAQPAIEEQLTPRGSVQARGSAEHRLTSVRSVSH